MMVYDLQTDQRKPGERLWKKTAPTGRKEDVMELLRKLITLRMSCSRGEMCNGHGRMCVCLSVPHCVLTLLHRPRCNLGEWQGCPLVVHSQVDLQLVHGFRCYGNIHVGQLIHLIHCKCIQRRPPLPSNRHHLRCGDRLEGKGENYQVCSVQYCLQQLCTVRCTHI